jgi:hypothetical protein
MKEEQQQFLRLLGQLPARLTAEQAAWVLNCQTHDVPILVAARLLKPSETKWAVIASLVSDFNPWQSKVSTEFFQHDFAPLLSLAASASCSQTASAFQRCGVRRLKKKCSRINRSPTFAQPHADSFESNINS